MPPSGLSGLVFSRCLSSEFAYFFSIIMATTMTMSTAVPNKRQRIRSHLASWVMLSPSTNPPYTPLPNEQHLFTSPPRIALAITTPAHFPGKKQEAFSATSSR